MSEQDHTSAKTAAASLRAAVHDLATKSVSIQPDPDALTRAGNQMTRVHLQDVRSEIGKILEGSD